MSALTLALALAIQTAAPPPADEAVVLVSTFLSTLERDPAGAQAMLTEDAHMGAGDMGGPMTAATFAEGMREFYRMCRQTSLARSTRPFDMPGRAIVIVTGLYHCVSPERPEGHDLDISYMVEHGRLAGVYLNVETGPRDGNRP